VEVVESILPPPKREYLRDIPPVDRFTEIADLSCGNLSIDATDRSNMFVRSCAIYGPGNAIPRCG